MFPFGIFPASAIMRPRKNLTNRIMKQLPIGKQSFEAIREK